jgi:hypothetical protein
MNPYMVKLARLGEILDAEPESRVSTHLGELEAIVDSLRPEDFAVYGKHLCHLLIDIARVKRVQFAGPEIPREIVLPEPQADPPTRPPKPKMKSPKSPYYTEYPNLIV